jgi:lysophospholipase L1-like esterase
MPGSDRTPVSLHVVGDSISIHYGPYLEKSLDRAVRYSRKEGKYQSLDVPAGANGGDSSQVLVYLDWLTAQGFRTDCLAVNCGLHDIKQDPVTGKFQVDLPQYRENLGLIVTAGQRIAGLFIWITTTPADYVTHWNHVKEFVRRNGNVLAYNQAAREIMNANKIPVIDLYTFTAALPGPLYCDHVHFCEKVRRKQGEYIAEELGRIILSHW